MAKNVLYSFWSTPVNKSNFQSDTSRCRSFRNLFLNSLWNFLVVGQLKKMWKNSSSGIRCTCDRVQKVQFLVWLSAKCDSLVFIGSKLLLYLKINSLKLLGRRLLFQSPAQLKINGASNISEFISLKKVFTLVMPLSWFFSILFFSFFFLSKSFYWFFNIWQKTLLQYTLFG